MASVSLQVMDLVKVWALGLAMEMLKALERVRVKGLERGKGLEMATEREWAMELEREMAWVPERLEVSL
jgi:hypothetical protein